MVSPVSVWQVLTIMGPGLTEVEFCYTIRYVVRNGRSTGPVWSVRRTAVYQQYQFQKRLSKWILLQPSVDSQRRFSEVQAQGRGKKHEHPMRYHVVFLFSFYKCITTKHYLVINKKSKFKLNLNHF